MSSTNRGAVRRKNDFYETPGWAVRAILPHLSFEGATVLEPGAGRGAIVRELLAAGVPSERVHAGEIDPALAATCRELGVHVGVLDFLEVDPEQVLEPVVDVAIMNPPYSLAMPFIERCLKLATTTAALLRLAFIAAQKRAAWHRANPSDLYVFPRRPSFTNDGDTDSAEYAWFVWGPGRGGRIQVLECEPREAALAKGGA